MAGMQLPYGVLVRTAFSYLFDSLFAIQVGLSFRAGFKAAV